MNYTHSLSYSVHSQSMPDAYCPDPQPFKAKKCDHQQDFCSTGVLWVSLENISTGGSSRRFAEQKAVGGWIAALWRWITPILLLARWRQHECAANAFCGNMNDTGGNMNWTQELNELHAGNIKWMCDMVKFHFRCWQYDCFWCKHEHSEDWCRF